MRILILLILSINLVLAQQSDNFEQKCSHAKTAKAFLSKKLTITELQNDYDVIFYDIDLTINPLEENIYGVVGVKGLSVVPTLDNVELDLYSGLIVESVKNELGDDLNFTHNSNLLTVTLNNPIGNGIGFNIIIKYNGQPQSSGFGSFGFSNHGGEPMIWSLSEPYGARDWWPCKDTPTDKADSVDISLEVPTGLIAASNGRLVNTEENGNWTTYHWQERYPIATYLVSVAIHPYKVFYDWYYTPTDSMRLEYYVYPDHYGDVQSTYGLTKDMIGAMAQRFGEYPFFKEKYGHAEFVWGGGMEHQTLTSLGRIDEGLNAHELGHQWWGDMVTCANFHHIWLNEGFATYSEALWYEIRDNDIQSLHDEMAINRLWYGYRPGTIYVEDTTSVSSIFSGPLSYAKASWVLHMLRHVVGDSAFFTGIQEYGERYRFKSAVTEQFQAVMEEISGKNLDYFFQRWIYGELYPIYEVYYQQSDNDLIVQINQIQTSEVFKMPIDLVIHYSDGSEELKVIHNSLREETFTISVENGKVVDTIELDPDEWILRKISTISRMNIDDSDVEKSFILYPVFPNPFNSELSIKLFTDVYDDVKISIFDINGKLVWEKTQPFLAGTHLIVWNGIDLSGNEIASGTYMIEAKTNDLVRSQKALYIK